MRKVLVLLTVLLLAGVALYATPTTEEVTEGWQPTKPITIIVPWGAGGSTDQVTRVVAAELEGPLGQRVVIVNTPGASGSVGTNEALIAPHDGYTWAAGAAADLGAYPIKDLLDTTWDDWVLYLSVANVSVVAVNKNAPYETMQDLLDAFEANPGDIAVATAGQLSAGHNAMEAIKAITGVEYKHVTYDGGNPAVIATVAGEAQVTTQLAVEEADMLRGGELRALAVLDNKSLNLQGYGEIPPITNWLPTFESAPNYFGIWVPADAPPEVIETMGEIWDTTIADSQALRDYAASRGAVYDPAWGGAAVVKALPFLSLVAWNYYDGGQAVISPADIGIPRP
jgi:tripartite-type tricarboxylate transporter receptor subunit TctC